MPSREDAGVRRPAHCLAIPSSVFPTPVAGLRESACHRVSSMGRMHRVTPANRDLLFPDIDTACRHEATFARRNKALAARSRSAVYLVPLHRGTTLDANASSAPSAPQRRRVSCCGASCELRSLPTTTITTFSCWPGSLTSRRNNPVVQRSGASTRNGRESGQDRPDSRVVVSSQSSKGEAGYARRTVPTFKEQTYWRVGVWRIARRDLVRSMPRTSPSL